MDINQIRLNNKNKYFILDSKFYNNQDAILDEIASKLNNGTQIIILNGNNLTDKNFIDSGNKIRELCSIYNALFIVIQRIDIAQIIHADGIQLEPNGIDIKHARELTGKNMIIGYFADREAEIKYAQENGADYIIYKNILLNKKINKKKLDS